jgi:hypothetical protein
VRCGQVEEDSIAVMAYSFKDSDIIGKPVAVCSVTSLVLEGVKLSNAISANYIYKYRDSCLACHGYVITNKSSHDSGRRLNSI